VEIPKSLLAAKEAAEAALASRDAIRQASAQNAVEVASAGPRIADLDREIEGLHGTVLADAALARVPAATASRMSPKALAETEQRLAAARAERDQLQQKSQEAGAAAGALQAAFADQSAKVIEAGSVFVKEKHQFIVALGAEFGRDVVCLILPELFKKWFPIAEGIGHFGIVNGLKGMGLTIAPYSGDPILFQGSYRDPDRGEMIDAKAAWRAELPLIAQHRALAEIAALDQRMTSMIAAAETQRREQAERDYQADYRRRQQGYHPVPVNRSSGGQPQTRQEQERAAVTKIHIGSDWPERNYEERIGGTPPPARP
jgi:hypothetical protein